MCCRSGLPRSGTISGGGFTEASQRLRTTTRGSRVELDWTALINVAVAAIAVGISFLAVMRSNQQQQRDAFFRSQEMLMASDLQQGRRLLGRATRAGELPANDEDYELVERALSNFNTVATLVRLRVVPRLDPRVVASCLARHENWIRIGVSRASDTYGRLRRPSMVGPWSSHHRRRTVPEQRTVLPQLHSS